MTNQTLTRLPHSVRNLQKNTQYLDIQTGDRVKVVVLPDDPDDWWRRFENVTFEFVWLTTNVETGKQWVDLWGGLSKHEAWVSVRPDRIVVVKKLTRL